MSFRTAGSRFVVVGILMALPGVTGFAQSRQSQSDIPSSAISLADILQRTGDRVQQYTASVLNVVCTETTQQLEVEPDLKTVKKKPNDLVYDFSIVRGTGFGIREQRELKLIDGQPPTKKTRPPGPDPTAFTTALTILLPEIREKFTFSYAGTSDLDGRDALIVDFVPATQLPNSVTWDGGRFRVSLQSKGRLWIDPVSYDVLRLDTHLIEPFEYQSPRVVRNGPLVLFGPRHKFKVETWDVSIRFGSTSFKDPEQTLMLPVSAESLRVFQGMRVPRLRITHSFTNYRRFTSEVKIGQ